MLFFIQSVTQGRAISLHKWCRSVLQKKWFCVCLRLIFWAG